MFDKYKNPNKKGLAQVADTARYIGTSALDKALGGKTPTQSLGAEVNNALSPTTPNEFQAHADARAEALMRQNGMTEKAPVAVPQSAEVTNHEANVAAMQIDLRDNQGPTGQVEGK